MTNLIFGCGYLGSRVARRWREAGHDVAVVTRDAGRARSLADEGYRPIVADVLHPESLADLPAAETVLYAIGYDRGGGGTLSLTENRRGLSRFCAVRGAKWNCPPLRDGSRIGSLYDVFVTGLTAVLNALPRDTGKLIYASSTGVYSQSQGEWVDELSPCEPAREGGRACLAAERAIAAHALGDRAIVLRLAGLYGPGRIPNAAAICRGEPILAPDRGFLNLIHVDDAANVVLAADQRAQPPRTYVVSDGHPVERCVYYEELARLLNAPPPRFAPPPADAPAAARAMADKRIDTARMRAELAVTLAYPSYREGLAAIVAAESRLRSRV